MRLGVIGVWYGLVNGGSGYFESGLQHSPAPESCATQPRRTVSDDCSYSTPRTPWVVIWDDIVCLTIRYHEREPIISISTYSPSTFSYGINSGNSDTEPDKTFE